MLQAMRLSNKFWAKVLATSVYLLNPSPTKDVMDRTPNDACHGREPFISHL